MSLAFGFALPHWQPLSGGFSPASLFAGGTAGAWYDPSDLSTMFTTSAGTTPVAMPGQGAGVAVGLILDKSGNGNHARSFGAGLSSTRPELSARVNLLTYSEEFDNAVWTIEGLLAFGSGSVANTTATTDPLGGNTADLIVQNTANSAHRILGLSRTFAANVAVVPSIYIKSAGARYIQFFIGIETNDPPLANRALNVDLQTGSVTQNVTNNSGVCQSIGNGWFRISFTMIGPSASVTNRFGVAMTDASYNSTFTGDGTSGIYIWGADLRPANIGANVPAYQRIADANTYDTSGFPLYLFFDGADDSMYTPANLNLSGTDKATVFAGVRKLSDAAAAVIAELSTDWNANNGSFVFTAPDGGGQNYGIAVKGSTGAFASLQTFAAPISNVVTQQYDIGATTVTDELKAKVNGANVSLTGATGSTGTGNFSTYPLFIGSRNNSSLWLNGNIYSLIIAGSAVSAGNISATEQYIANKTGIQI